MTCVYCSELENQNVCVFENNDIKRNKIYDKRVAWSIVCTDQ